MPVDSTQELPTEDRNLTQHQGPYNPTNPPHIIRMPGHEPFRLHPVEGWIDDKLDDPDQNQQTGIDGNSENSNGHRAAR